MASKRSPITPKPSLLPTPRRPSFTTPGPLSPTVATNGPSGFRALRSLLPFGPTKQPSSVSPSSPNSTPNTNGTSRFASFSVVRKSMQREPSFSASHSATDLPVMVIDQSAGEEIPLRKSVSLHEKPLPSHPPDVREIRRVSPEPNRATTRDEPPVVSQTYRTPSPNPELSTIIEADTSGISKHLPSASPSPSPSPPSLPQHSISTDDTSALDLSTSQLEAQVKDAILAQATQSAAAQKWFNISHESSPEAADASFNLGALDPELAALLSPNRIVSSRIKPSMDLSDSPPPGLMPQHQSSRPRLRPIQRPTPPPSDRRSPSVSPSTTHSTAVRKPPPSPLSLSHPPSPVGPAPPSPLTDPSPHNSSTPAVRRTQHGLTTSTPQTSLRRPLLGRMPQQDSWEGSSTSRTLTTRPSLDSYRPSTSTTSLSRGSLDIPRQRPSLDTMRRGGDSETSHAWNARFQRQRKRSMSVDEQTSPSTSTSRNASPQRQLSRPGSSLANRAEWLGPRTAKAFRAAGLLGPPGDNESGEAQSPSEASRSGRFRFGSVRAPSRSERMTSPAFGSTRRRGSGSGSYFGSAGSQLGESPTLTLSSRDTPRSASTAPTSVSGASWERDRDEIRELKDKHAIETGALLSALSDSQRTTKVLREENNELRQRLAKLETDTERITQMERENVALREFVSELREEAGQLKLQLRLAAPVSVPVASTSKYVPTQPFRLAEDDSFQSSAATRNTTTTSNSKAKRRLSSSSSNFAAPPSNMSLLLNEDGGNSSDFDERSGTLAMASPTMVFGRVMTVDSSPTPGHRANRSVTSMATTEQNTSIGSPRSLLLRPYDEHHLEDLEHDSLDLEHEDWED
ncbi:DUF2012 domain-containing protein [Mycena indigotica]|uniref:DUF2012 domain-containing protein n=1 Tax=Mycena indigotica TaxID=2126181 RepID=A0A8H6W9I7_9AGAR|nr:DUF2012 domain-containing protein [Mycena indigotica]KAF7306663.1 DUF2012 domain-containing protein [Mycena indigotica]